jgi:hypothetical protein
MKVRLLLPLLIICFSSSAAAEVEVFTQQDWNQGAFSGTSADRNDNSGNLGLGYRNGTASDSIVGYWRLDKSVSGNGGTVLDYSGRGKDGSTGDGINTGAEGVFSTNSFIFDGSNDYVKTDLTTSPDHITISAWFKAQSWDSGCGNYIVGKEVNNNNDKSFMLRNCGNGGLEYVMQDGGTTWYYARTDGLPTTGVWHHTVATYDGDTSKIYLDGTLRDQNTGPSGSLEKNNENMWIGSDNSFTGRVFDGNIDEIRIYDRALSSTEVKNLYLNGKPFSGNYTQSIQNSESTEWEKIEIDTSSIPKNTDVDAVFKTLDFSDNLVDKQVIEIHEGKNNYSLDVSDSEKAEVVFNGSSSDVKSSWEIKGFKVYAGFCDYRGQKNECVMNSTRQLESKTYDVSSIFESRSTAVFEAFSGTSALNISNSSRLSGTWKGSFDVRSNPVTIEPGANFKPENGRIIIGE